MRRRFKRGALPSALMGLVAFSFTLVVFGAAVYTMVIPSLVAANQHGISDSLLFSVLEAIAGGDGAATGWEDAEPGGQSDGKGTDDATVEPDAEASGSEASRRPSISLNGMSLLGIAQTAAGEKPGSGQTKPERPDDEQGSQQDPGAGSGGQQGGSDDVDDEGQSDEPAPNPEPDPVKEQAFYEFLVGKAQLIEGYLAEVNACVDAFNTDCTNASLDVRIAHQKQCEALEARLVNEYLEVRDRPLSEIPEHTQYRDEQGSLTGMFRCLCGYVGTIRNAWTLNVAFEDPAAHVDEFMSAIYADESNGVNKYLAEFQQIANGFEL